MTQSTRERRASLTIPTVRRRESRYCSFCGALVKPETAERAYRHVYCNSECHKAGRRANAAENAKRRKLRAALPTAQRPTTGPQVCGKCNKSSAEFPDDFYLATERGSGLTRLCRDCEAEKFRAYYAREREKIKARSRTNKREARARTWPEVPAGIALSPRQLHRCRANMSAILADLPADAPAVLMESLSVGKINGMVFEDRGGCGCLWGTLGRAYHWSIAEEGEWARRFRQRWCAEVDLFGHIAPGDTAATNPYAAIIADTILRYMEDAPHD